MSFRYGDLLSVNGVESPNGLLEFGQVFLAGVVKVFTFVKLRPPNPVLINDNISGTKNFVLGCNIIKNFHHRVLLTF